MIEINNIAVFNFEGALRGMRNPLESWNKNDSFQCDGIGCTFEDCPKFIKEIDGCNYSGQYIIGDNDLALAQRLIKAGSDESKFMRQIFVSMDITAPIYWWKEMDTYKVATTANSTSTMHKLMDKPITIGDFSVEDLSKGALSIFKHYINFIEEYRDMYTNGFDAIGLAPKDKRMWRQIIQMLPNNYNQTRTWTADYAVLRNIYKARRNHKLDEWKEFCKMVEELPYGKELICL